MKKFALLWMAALLVGVVGCKEDDPVQEGKVPSIVLEKGTSDALSFTFKATVTNAEQATYLVLPEEEALPSLATILEEGELIDLRKGNTVEIKISGLEPSTAYQVVAAASNEAGKVGSNTLHMTTTARAQMSLSVELVQKDHEKINFRFNATNAETVHYLVVYADRETPTAQYVVTNGEEVSADLRESIEVSGLECAKEYQLLVVAVGNGEMLMADPLFFETDDNPNNVISHTYTRAKGSCLDSGSAFVQLSYENADEADNFAYNDLWLGLDFRFEAGNEYLPAGLYEVKGTAENGTLFNRYSNYGYDNGVQLDKGTVYVTIHEGAEHRYYRFEVDVYLLNGRHLQATYEGEVDGMPIHNTITVKTSFTRATAVKQSEDGSKWTLTLTDAENQTARFDLYNTYAAKYLAVNIYTCSTSAEANNSDFEPGEFDGTTSTFTVVGGAGAGVHKYANGTLHVDLDWTSERYLMTFFGTLENGVVVEAEYVGAVEGISLAPSTEEIEVTFERATASSLDKGAYWSLNFTNAEGYEARFSAECAASPLGLPAGEYTAGMGAGHIDLATAYIKVPGERQYYYTALSVMVSIDYEASTYRFDLTGKLEDGRTYFCTYEGIVEGMEVEKQEELLDRVPWASASASGWGTWWTLTMKSADGEYEVAIDLRSPSDLYLPSGTYVVKEDTSIEYAVMLNYSILKIGGKEYGLSEVTLLLTYDEDSFDYQIDLSMTLSNGSQIGGTYAGPVTGSPKQ